MVKGLAILAKLVSSASVDNVLYLPNETVYYQNLDTQTREVTVFCDSVTIFQDVCRSGPIYP